jgi:hypothetical protein
MEKPWRVGKIKFEINKCLIMENSFNIEAIGK